MISDGSCSTKESPNSLDLLQLMAENNPTDQRVYSRDLVMYFIFCVGICKMQNMEDVQ